MGNQSRSQSLLTRLVQMEVLPGRPVENTAVILEHIRNAKKEKIKLIVFPEMAVPGYLIGDLWEFHSFIKECELCTREIISASEKIVTVFGNIAIDWRKTNEDGRVRKYNALFVAENRKLKSPKNSPYPFVIKTLLPNYREFDESRYFYDLRKLSLELGKPLGKLISPVLTSLGNIACFLCEDAWDMDYAQSPIKSLASHNPDIFINISASPFTINKNAKRNRVYARHAINLGRPIIYVNHTGIQNNGKTVFTFDGRSCIYDAHGNSIEVANPFEEAVLTYNIPLSSKVKFGKPIDISNDTIAEVYNAINYGTSRFLKLCNADKVTIGISGGIDSAVAAAIYRKILSPTNLLLVNMPGEFTSSTTISLARILATNLGCLYTEIPIEKSVELTRSQINGITVTSVDGKIRKTIKISGIVMENIQARDRSSRVLAAISAAFGGVFTCNANKSEATVGYTTLYGDLCGYFANLADLWKMEIYELANYINNHVYSRSVIPKGIFEVKPSAELSSAQNVDKNQGDPFIYPYHDKLFTSWVERWDRISPEEILKWYKEGSLEKNIGWEGNIHAIFPSPKIFIEDLERWWNQYQGMGLAKRIQAPPILALKKRAFGFDHRESQLGTFYTRAYFKLKKQILS